MPAHFWLKNWVGDNFLWSWIFVWWPYLFYLLCQIYQPSLLLDALKEQLLEWWLLCLLSILSRSPQSKYHLPFALGIRLEWWSDVLLLFFYHFYSTCFFQVQFIGDLYLLSHLSLHLSSFTISNTYTPLKPPSGCCWIIALKMLK